MATELIRNLLESGVHFGHQTRRWNPKMSRFIFGERGGIHIIDLEKTVDYLTQAADFIESIAAKGGSVLFIGTKKQAQDAVEKEAQRSESYFVQNRWMGGLLTNFETAKKSIEKLKRIEKMEADGVFGKLTKKEVSVLRKQQERLLRDIGGIRDMKQLPQAVIVVDTKREHIAVKEAMRLNIPIVGLVDSNCDPDNIQYPVPANDDAVKSIRFLLAHLSDRILEGRKQFQSGQAKAAEAAKVKPETVEDKMAKAPAESKE